jgi:hypothetical protein
MGDPSDRHAVDEIAFFTGAYVVRAVATQMQIAWCLAHYYGHVTALGQRLLEPTGAPYRGGLGVSPEPLPRAKGLTGKVDAARHRVVAPVTTPPPIPRPTTPEAPTGPNGEHDDEHDTPQPDGESAAELVAELVESQAADGDATPPLGTADPAAPIETHDGDTDVTPSPPRSISRSAHRAGARRRSDPRSEPDAVGDDEDEDDGPVITMVVGGDDDPTGHRYGRHRRRIKTDPRSSQRPAKWMPDRPGRQGRSDRGTAGSSSASRVRQGHSLSGELKAVHVRDARTHAARVDRDLEDASDVMIRDRGFAPGRARRSC